MATTPGEEAAPVAEGSSDTVTSLYRMLASGDSTSAIALVEDARGSIAQSEIFDSVFAPAMAMLGAAWASGELDEYAFAQAAVAADQLIPFVTKPSVAQDSGVTILVGVMRGDGHSSAKNIVASALRMAGHRVVDLGDEVSGTEFAERAEDSGARIVIVCAEQLVSAITVEHVADALRAAGRDDVAVLACGGPFVADPGLARRVGARGVVHHAQEALEIVDRVAAWAGAPAGGATW